MKKMKKVDIEARIFSDYQNGKFPEYTENEDKPAKKFSELDFENIIGAIIYETDHERMNMSVDFENFGSFQNKWMNGIKYGVNVIDGYEFIAFEAGGDWEYPAVIIAYINVDDQWSLYVPSKGNIVCLPHGCAYGSCQDHCDDSELDADGFVKVHGEDPEIEPNPGSIIEDIQENLMGVIAKPSGKIDTDECKEFIIKWVKANLAHLPDFAVLKEEKNWKRKSKKKNDKGLFERSFECKNGTVVVTEDDGKKIVNARIEVKI